MGVFGVQSANLEGIVITPHIFTRTFESNTTLHYSRTYNPTHSKFSFNFNAPFRTILSLLFPTNMSYVPALTLQTFRAASQNETAYLSRCIATLSDFPGFRSLALPKPLSCDFGVVRPLSGRVMYI